MKILRKIYLRIKVWPIIGKVAVSIRDAWHFSSFKKHLLFRQDLAQVKTWAKELFPDQLNLLAELDKLKNLKLFKQAFSYGHAGDFDFLALYLIVRATKPEVVVETGVASGRSSAAILLALEKNETGVLYSIDLPQFYSSVTPETYLTPEGNKELKAFVPKGQEPGWLVPSSLRSKWRLILGDSRVELPKLLNQLLTLDIFYHDSDHSYESMMFEFETTWPRIKSGGFLLSDDVKWNKSWTDFVSRNETIFNKTYRSFGVSKKK